MANPTASPTAARANAGITLTADTKFELLIYADWASLRSGEAAIYIEPDAAQACSDLINQLFEVLAHLRHEQADAKRCDARASGEAV